MMTLFYPSDPPLLRGAIWLCLIAVPISLLLLGFDRRILDDETLWLKPLKFHLSLAVHGITVLLAVRFLPEAWQTHIATKIGLFVFGAVIVYEAVFLSLQAGRGVRSHFNDTTAFDAIGGTIMAAGAGVLVIVPLLLGVALAITVLRSGVSGIAENPLPFALALGFILAGWLGAQTGSAIGANGGPFVGVDPAAGPFMPLTGWSLSGGDYRISHFIGVHAMQALPLAALILLAILPSSVVAALTIPLASGWAGLTLFTLARASEGLPPL
ncbi:hypothetical protein AAD018_017745 [Aestuariibius insulae]|uniref:hypothetical protein n=1 Tax=Aestuariibius insulae TaxID=2058287 RepID=UPI00345E8A53